MELSTHLPNRRDIDGLRAISVLCVFLYHLEVPAFGGGFVGVDLFFVISGYLISRNVLSDAERGRFSIQRFYERRIRRLFPAALITILGTLLIGALWFSPEHFKSLTQDVVAALGSVSNFYFWRGSHAYFAKAADPSAVLHFWSLAVEEQFYLAARADPSARCLFAVRRANQPRERFRRRVLFARIPRLRIRDRRARHLCRAAVCPPGIGAIDIGGARVRLDRLRRDLL